MTFVMTVEYDGGVTTQDERLADVQDEYRKAAESWDRQRDRLNSEVERLSRELSRSFWSPREWEEWSNELASALPEEAEGWPGVNPEGAQESIIKASLLHLVGALARVEAMCERLDQNGGVASPQAIRNTLAGRPAYARGDE